MFKRGTVVEECRRKGKRVYACFIDIEKAFDRVNRKKLWDRLKRLGMNDRERETIERYYVGNEIKLKIGQTESKWVKNNVGVRQGCTMSPVLFNVFIEELLERLIDHHALSIIAQLRSQNCS